MTEKSNIEKISVIVPKNPFVRPNLQQVSHCLAALDVERLMEWWPGRPHTPNRQADKVRAIQRSLDWKRVAQIAAYLLQEEIIDVPDLIDEFFREIYEPRRLEPGRDWPPRVSRVIGFERSEFPTFSNVLVHVNGATIEPLQGGAAHLIFDTARKDLHFSVVDGQHRINGAYFAVKLLRKKKKIDAWEIPSDIFIDLDPVGAAPRRQAQIFIDVNFYQKKVDRSLVADLFPTTRGSRGPLDDKERAQDLGRRLMLETGPLVGMIQIPGIKFGVKDVVALATLNLAIEEVLKYLRTVGLAGLDEQTEFLAQFFDSWLEASGRKHDLTESAKLDPENVAYQGRVLVSALTLVPVCLLTLRGKKATLISDVAHRKLTGWFARLMKRAGLIRNDRFVGKSEFKSKGYLGSGGIGRFRDTLWAASIGTTKLSRSAERRAKLADENRAKAFGELGAA